MYPKKQPKSDREKFYGAFQKKVGCKPEQYLRRKLAGGMPEAELRRLYTQRNARLHLEDSMSANFRKGEGYHQRSYFLLRLRRMAWKIAVLLFAAAAFGGYVWVKYSGMG